MSEIVYDGDFSTELEKALKQLDRVRRTHPIVQRMMEQHAPLESIIVALAASADVLFERLQDVEAIAPRRYRMKDGTEMIWTCPDHLIPITEIRGAP